MVSPSDWQLRTSLWAAGAITTLQLALVILGSFGLYIPVLNQLTGFVFVAFVPGLLLLRILRVNRINPLEAIAYIVGLSLFCSMACGALINFVLPPLGLDRPLTPLPVALSLSALIAMLMTGAWLRESRVQPVRPAEKISFDPLACALLLLLALLVILGLLVLNRTGSNAVMIILIITVCLYFCLGLFKRGIGETAYPAAIYIISLVLLYQSSLLSPYLTGSDIYFEYHFYRMAAVNGVWDFTLPGTINSCLSIVMGLPLFSQMMHLDGAWVLKAVYPVIFSLVPLIMYRIIRIQAGKIAAFLAVFFFISMPTFSLELVSLGRQQFAELFFALIILLFIERKIYGPAKAVMLVIFALGVSVSHYTLGFINLVCLGALLVLIVIMRSRIFIKSWERLSSSTGGLPLQLRYTGVDALPVRYLALVVVGAFALSFAWYAVAAGGSNLEFFVGTLVMLMQKIGINLEGLARMGGGAAEYLLAGRNDVIVSAALGLDFSQVSLPGRAFRIIQYITQVLIVAGCIRLLIKPSGLKFGREYISFSLLAAMMLASCIVLPWFSNILNITRWYHIALITLCPFLVIGARSLWELGAWLWSRWKRLKSGPVLSERYVYWLALLIILPYFVFTSGLVFELVGQSDTNVIDTPYSFSLSSHRLDLAGNFNRQDGAAARWLSQRACDNATVFTDVHAFKVVEFEDYPPRLRTAFFDRNNGAYPDGYIFFTSWNTSKDELAFFNEGRPGMREHLGVEDLPGLSTAMQSGNRIYINGGSEVWQIRDAVKTTR